MTLRLALDAVRLLCRGRPALVVAAAGLLTGLFARATRDAGVRHLQGGGVPGAALETLAGALFLAGLVAALVAGLHLAREDRRSGLLPLLAVRGVRRGTYAGARLLGLELAAAAYLLLLGLVALAAAGLGGGDLPEVRERIRPARILAGDRELEHGAVAQLAAGSAGRFEFGAGAVPDATLKLRPKLTFGQAFRFDGRLELNVALVDPATGARQERELPPFRPLAELDLRFAPPPGGGRFVIEVEPRSPAFVLEVDRDALTTLGRPVAHARQFAAALVLGCAAAGVLAAFGFLFGIGLAAGPAGLLGAFVLVIGLGKGAALDVAAGIGGGAAPAAESKPAAEGVAAPDALPAAGSSAANQPSGPALWLRAALTGVLRLVPDLAALDPSERLGAGDALEADRLGAALLVLAAALAACLLLGAVVAPFRER